MIEEREAIKILIVSLYFPEMRSHKLEDITLLLKETEHKFMLFLRLPKRFRTDYRLVAKVDEVVTEIKIMYREKDPLKDLLKLINN